MLGESFKDTAPERILKMTFDARTKEWTNYSYTNWPFIKEIYENDKENFHDAWKWPKLGIPEPCLVVASGPSQEKLLPLMKGWQWTIMSTPSRAQAVHHVLGREPDWIVACDAGEVTLRELAAEGRRRDMTKKGANIGQPSWRAKPYKTAKLMLHPCCHPALLDYWQAHERMWWFRETHPKLSLCTDTLPLQYDFINTSVPMGGDVISSIIQLADYFGYEPIFIVGLDYGFPYGKLGSARISWRSGKGFYPIEASPIVLKTATRRCDDGCRTSEVLLGYKQSFMATWYIDQPPICLVGPYEGTLYEAPQLPAGRIMEIFNHPHYNYRKAYEVWRPWLKEQIGKVTKPWLEKRGIVLDKEDEEAQKIKPQRDKITPLPTSPRPTE